MPIIEVNHVTKECKLGQLTNLKRTALDDIAIGAASVSNSRAPLKIRHSLSPSRRRGEGGNPACLFDWTPAFAGATKYEFLEVPSICRSGFNHENLELALTRLTYFTNPQES